MDQRTRLARPEDHRAYVRAIVRRAGELERRAAVLADELFRKAESMRASAIGNTRLLRAIDELIAATEQSLAAAENLHRAIVRFADEEPQVTRWQRWRVRRELKKALATLARGVAELEKKR